MRSVWETGLDPGAEGAAVAVGVGVVGAEEVEEEGCHGGVEGDVGEVREEGFGDVAEEGPVGEAGVESAPVGIGA